MKKFTIFPGLYLSILVTLGVAFCGTEASAGNLPVWGGAATTTQPQQIQEPSKPNGSQPAANIAQTVQQPQPGTWTAPATTSSPTISTPVQQPSYQPKVRVAPQTGFTPKQPSSRPLISGTPVQRTATQYGPVGHGEIQGYNSWSDPPEYSFAMQATPDHLVYTVNPQGEVTGGGNIEITLQSIPATTMDQNCDPWMWKLEFFSQTHHERLPNGAPVPGEFNWSSFNTLELPWSQSCYFDISAPFQRTFWR